MRTTEYTKSKSTNTGFAGVSYSAGVQRGYMATNLITGRRRMILINSKRSREQALILALEHANQ